MDPLRPGCTARGDGRLHFGRLEGDRQRHWNDEDDATDQGTWRLRSEISSLLGAPGIATSNKDATNGTKGIATKGARSY